MTDHPEPQQEYHARPDHSLRDIMWIHSLGYAIPGDGDRNARHRKEEGQ